MPNRRISALFAAAFAIAAVVGLAGARGAAHAGTTGPTPGIATLRTGGSYSTGSGYDRYSYVIAGPGDAAAAGALPTMSLIYQAGVDVNVNWSTGVPYSQALANGWLLKDSSGNNLVNAGYTSNYIGDVGSSAYQQAWANNVASLLVTNHDRGVFIDDVIMDIGTMTGGKYPAKYPSQSAWQQAMASFIASVGQALKAKGLYVLVNATGYISGNAGSDDGSLTATWWQQLGPYVSGLMYEYWQQNPTNEVLRTSGTDWYRHWDGWENLPAVAQSLGDDFFGLQYASSSNTQVMRYGKASFLLGWNGAGGAYMFNPDGGGDAWNAEWTTDIGTPRAARYSVGVGWRRDYSGGTVVLNQSPTTSQTFALGGTYLMPDGSSVTAVTLAPSTALILTLASTISVPQATAAPAVAGTTQSGQPLTSSAGTWSGSPTTYSYQWERCDVSGASCGLIAGANGSSYSTTSSDVGPAMRSMVTASNSAGSASATSPATPGIAAPQTTTTTTTTTANVTTTTAATTTATTTTTAAAPSTAPAPTNTSAPTVSGVPRSGKAVTASAGSWSGSPTSFAYAWLRCDAGGGSCQSTGVSGPTYSLTNADVGATVLVVVTAQGPGGSASAASASSAPVRPWGKG